MSMAMNNEKIQGTNIKSDSIIVREKQEVRKIEGKIDLIMEVDGVKYAIYPEIISSKDGTKSVDLCCRNIPKHDLPSNVRDAIESHQAEIFQNMCQKEFQAIDLNLQLIGYGNLRSSIEKAQAALERDFKKTHSLIQDTDTNSYSMIYMKLHELNKRAKALLDLREAVSQFISDLPIDSTNFLDQISNILFSREEESIDCKILYEALTQEIQNITDHLKSSANDAEDELRKAVLQDINALKIQKKRFRLDAPVPEERLYDASKNVDVRTSLNQTQPLVRYAEKSLERYSYRAHHDAKETILELLDKQGFKRSQIGPKHNCYHYSLLDTQFSLTEYLKNKPEDRRAMKWSDQAHFDAYNAAFAEAFTRYYQELHKHMKSHSTRSKQDDGRTYYSVSRPKDGCARVKHEFEFSFEKSPQKENIAVIDREIKEMVSAYQTAFFILESMNSNKELAAERYKDLRDKFEGDIGRLLNERAACINTLSDELQKDIPQAPTYHVIVSYQRVLEVRAPDTNAEKKEYLHEKDLKWEESYLKQILSLQTILNCLRMLTRVLQRYVSALTSSHHRQMNQKHAAYTKQYAKINNTLMCFTQNAASVDTGKTAGADNQEPDLKTNRNSM